MTSVVSKLDAPNNHNDKYQFAFASFQFILAA
jgi:hypothetical protein